VISTRRKGASITIGEDFAMTGGTICADTRIEIGDRVTVGANSTIVDTDFHPIAPSLRLSTPNLGESSPTIIEDDVFIGANCMVLKGVRIGRCSVIGAGSIVVSSVSPYSVAAGVPAKVISSIREKNHAELST
jgi:acetyltransferase-like isoleucine patch superfamily enzyme